MNQYEVTMQDGLRHLVSAARVDDGDNGLEFTADGERVAMFNRSAVAAVKRLEKPAECPPIRTEWVSLSDYAAGAYGGVGKCPSGVSLAAGRPCCGSDAPYIR